MSDKNLSDEHRESISEGVNKILRKKYYPTTVKILSAEYVSDGNKHKYLEDGSKKHLGNYSIGVVLNVEYNKDSTGKVMAEGLQDGTKKGIFNARNDLKAIENSQKREALFNVSTFMNFSFSDDDIFWEELGVMFDSTKIYKEAIGIFPESRRMEIGKSNHKKAKERPRTDEAKKKISKKVSKPVLFLNTGQVFSSQTVAAEGLGIKQSTISDICRSFKNFGKTVTGRRLKKETRDGKQFVFLLPEEYERFVDSRLVRCITDGRIYFCYADAADEYGLSVEQIKEASNSGDEQFGFCFSHVEVSRFNMSDKDTFQKFVRCITNRKIYNDIENAVEETGFTYDEIFRVCTEQETNIEGYIFDFVKAVEVLSNDVQTTGSTI
jgi:hypothetical protein